MNIKLYNYKGNLKKCNKKDYLTLFKNLEGELRESCNILSPEFTIELFPSELLENAIINEQGINIVNSNGIAIIVQPEEVVFANEITQLQTCNYAYIEEFKRYYFITDFILLSSNLVRIRLSVDVLYTYYEDYENLFMLIDRANIENYSKKIKDDLLISTGQIEIKNNFIQILDTPLNATKKVKKLEFEKDYDIFKEDYHLIYNIVIGGLTDIEIGDTWERHGYTTPNSEEGIYANASGFTQGTTIYNQKFVFNADEAETFAIKISEDSNLASYVKSVKYYLHKLDVSAKEEYQLKDFKFNAGLLALPNVSTYFWKRISFTKPYTLFTWFDLEAKHYIFLPYYGLYEINMNKLFMNFANPNITLEIYYTIDYLSGEGKITIHDPNTLLEYDNIPIKVGIDVTISYTNQDQVERNNQINENTKKSQITQSIIKGVATVGATALTVATGGATAPLLVGMGALNLGTQAYKSAQVRDLQASQAQSASFTSSGVSALGQMASDYVGAQNQYVNAQINNIAFATSNISLGSLNAVQLIKPFISSVSYYTNYNNYNIYTQQYDTEFTKINGAPVKKMLKITSFSLNTYFKVSQCNLEIEAFPNELLELENLLKSGVYK